MREITKEEIEEISDLIWLECDNGEGLTGHGRYCMALLEEVIWGKTPIVYDTGLNYFGLEEWLEFRLV